MQWIGYVIICKCKKVYGWISLAMSAYVELCMCKSSRENQVQANQTCLNTIYIYDIYNYNTYNYIIIYIANCMYVYLLGLGIGWDSEIDYH